MAIQIVLMCVSSLAWGIGFSKGLGGIAKLIAWSVFVDYFFIGFVISTLCWLVATYVLSSSSSSPDSSQDSPLPSTLKEARRQQRHSSSSSNSNNNFSNGGGSRYGTPGGSVEWLYSFDVHCNGFFPVFIMTHVVQYVVAPLLFTGSFFSALLANALYGASYVYYFYVTFLGYQSLPFVKKADAFLYPAAVLALALVILTLFKFNTSLFLSNFYFGN